MFLLMAVSASAITLFEEKNTGDFQRLLSSLVRPAHILWARFLFGIILGLAQITALLAAGRVFLSLEILNHPGALLAVAASAAAACSAMSRISFGGKRPRASSSRESVRPSTYSMAM